MQLYVGCLLPMQDCQPDIFAVIGNEQWMDVLPTKYLNEFLNSTATPFIDSDKRNAGYVRSAGKGAGNVAYMAVYEAGHMVC